MNDLNEKIYTMVSNLFLLAEKVKCNHFYNVFYAPNKYTTVEDQSEKL